MSGGGHGKSKKARGGHDHEEHEEHVNHEAWVIPYADLLTLLMAMFIALFAMSTVDAEKFEAVAESFRKELGGDSPVDLGGSDAASPLPGGGSVIDGLGPAPVRSDRATATGDPSAGAVISEGLPEVLADPDLPAAIDTPPATFEVIPSEDNPEGDALTEVEQIVLGRIAGTGMAGSLSLRREARGLVVTIVTDQVLFEEARAELQEPGVVVLDVIAQAIADLPNDVVVEGHTDARPLVSGRYADNWELSYARAAAVMRHLVDTVGFPADRVALTAYADTRPIDTAGTAEAMAKNRRVEIVVLED